jgi:hypothetical protein
VLHEIVADPETAAGDAVGRYADALRETLDAHGPPTGVDGATVRAIRDGDAGGVTLDDAAAVLAADPERPDAAAIVAEARDDLLMAMTTVIVDVDAVAAELDVDLTPRDVQQRVEGRAPTTLDEYARIRNAIGA